MSRRLLSQITSIRGQNQGKYHRRVLCFFVFLTEATVKEKEKIKIRGST